MRKDKNNSTNIGNYKITVAPSGTMITMYDFSSGPTDWNITKNNTGEFQLVGITAGHTGSFLIKKLQDAPDCPQLTGVTSLPDFQTFGLSGDLRFLSYFDLKSNKLFDYSWGELYFPHTTGPGNNTLVANDSLIYQPYKLTCPGMLFLFKGGNWVKQ